MITPSIVIALQWQCRAQVHTHGGTQYHTPDTDNITTDQHWSSPAHQYHLLFSIHCIYMSWCCQNSVQVCGYHDHPWSEWLMFHWSDSHIAAQHHWSSHLRHSCEAALVQGHSDNYLSAACENISLILTNAFEKWHLTITATVCDHKNMNTSLITHSNYNDDDDSLVSFKTDLSFFPFMALEGFNFHDLTILNIFFTTQN